MHAALRRALGRGCENGRVTRERMAHCHAGHQSVVINSVEELRNRCALSAARQSAPPSTAPAHRPTAVVKAACAIIAAPLADQSGRKSWPITEPGTFFTFASGRLGWNLPASVGIALGERDTGRNRPVIMIIGNGSF